MGYATTFGAFRNEEGIEGRDVPNADFVVGSVLGSTSPSPLSKARTSWN
jgi:hypothetical protein